MDFACFNKPNCPASSVTPALTVPGCGFGCCEDTCIPCLPSCDKPIFRECVSRPCPRHCLDPSYPNMPVPPRNPPRCDAFNGFMPGKDPNYCIDDKGGCYHKAQCYDDFRDGKERRNSNGRGRPECCELDRCCSRGRRPSSRDDRNDRLDSREERKCRQDSCYRKSSPTECCQIKNQPTKTKYVMPCYRYEDGRIEQFVPVVHGKLPKTVFMRNGTQDHVNGYRGAMRVMCAGCTDSCLPPCVYSVIEPIKTYYKHITKEKGPTLKKDRDFCQSFKS